jgi:hypothetical protein
MRLSSRSRLVIGVTYLLLMSWFLTDRLANWGSMRASVFTGNNLRGGFNIAQGNLTGGISSSMDPQQPILRFINLVLPFIGIGAVVAFLAAGFMLLLGFGSEGSITRAKKIMFWTIVGLLVVLLAVTIVQLILEIT